MGKYLHHYETESDFNTAYNGEDYIEPWVSYTEHMTSPGEEVTAFTWDRDTYYTLDLTGKFTYVGDYYMPGYDWETQERVYDMSVAVYYYPLWSNGKTYVFTGDYNWQPVRDVMQSDHIFSVTPDAQHPGFITGSLGGIEGAYEQKLTKAIEPKQVAYNKNENAIYLTWDGTSMTKLREGTEVETEYPTYVVDQAKSKGDVKMANIYINGELAYTLSDFDNSHYVGGVGAYTDVIVFGKDSNGNKTCTYTYSFELV